MACLWFDGSQLNVINNGVITKSWIAFSGNAGVNKSNAEQRQQNRGPIPEECWVIDPTKITYRDKLWFWVRNQHPKSGWGDCWVRLEPCDPDTYQRFNRTPGFYIHGGEKPGSKGCIDLLGQDKNFCSWFSSYGKKICVIVRYLPETKTKSGIHSSFNDCPDAPGVPCGFNHNCSERYNRNTLDSERASMLPGVINTCDTCPCCNTQTSNSSGAIFVPGAIRDSSMLGGAANGGSAPCVPGAWECSSNGNCYGTQTECMRNCRGGRCNAI